MTPRVAMRTVLAMVALTAIASPVPALAEARPPKTPPQNLAIMAQYIEQVPTSGGSIPVVSSRGYSTSISPTLKAKIEREAGADTYLLRRVVSAAEFGAPQQLTSATGRARAATTSGVVPAGSEHSGEVVGFAVVLVGMTIGAGAIVVRQRLETRS